MSLTLGCGCVAAPVDTPETAGVLLRAAAATSAVAASAGDVRPEGRSIVGSFGILGLDDRPVSIELTGGRSASSSDRTTSVDNLRFGGAEGSGRPRCDP